MSIFSQEDKTAMAQMILARLAGKIDDEAWNSFTKGLNEVCKNPSICRECGGGGFVFKEKSPGYEYVFRCSSCYEGRIKPFTYPLNRP
jgi:hypothetical protein